MSIKNTGLKYIKNIFSTDEIIRLNYECQKSINLRDQVSKGTLFIGNSDIRGYVKMMYTPRISLFPIYRCKKIIESIIGEKIFPTYWFTTFYYPGSFLGPHFDNEACELSMSINLNIHDNNWNLNFIDLQEREQNINVKPKDGIFYFGNKLFHWRERLDNTSKCHAQLFLHYVRSNGKYNDLKYNTKKEIKEYILKKV